MATKRDAASRAPVPPSTPEGSLSESQLISWWKSVEPGIQLAGLNGEPVYVLQCGRRNVYDGPDFLGANLLLDGRAVQGDIEFHVQERDWYAHHHDRDSRYNHVVLHVVAKRGRRRATTHAGSSVCVVEVSPDRTPLEKRVTCKLDITGEEDLISAVVLSLARIRWVDRVTQMRHAIRRSTDVPSAFYVRSFWSLGLKGNEHLFERLAVSLPLTTFSTLEDPDEVLALLYGVAGFFDSDSGKDEMADSGYRRLWLLSSKQLDVSQEFSSVMWRRRGIRPRAFPERRIQIGAKIVHALIGGWEPWNITLEQTLSDFERILGHLLGPKGWGTEWLGNVVIPFQEAWDEVGATGGNEGRFSDWFELNLGYTYGKLSRLFSGIFTQSQLSNFGIQQGLLALQERYCELDLCRLCPMRE